jgi:type I restriction enzyme, R subunit
MKLKKMDRPSFKEDHISQIPALQMLVNLGYTYSSPTEADRQRGGKTTNVMLEDILRKQLKEINAFNSRVCREKRQRVFNPSEQD